MIKFTATFKVVFYLLSNLLIQSVILTQKGLANEHFDRVVVVVLENADYADVMRDPYFKTLTKQGTLFSNFYAITRPSFPNYLAMVAGSDFGVSSNSSTTLNETSIADLLEARGLSWKSYAEDYPGNCFLGSTHRKYVRKHAPLISFKGIQKDPKRCANLQGGEQFQEDWKARKLPNYSFYVPDMDNDGHDTGISFSSKWLKGFLTPLLSDSEGMKGTLIEITYDESSKYLSTNQVYTLLLGPMVQTGSVIKTKYSHYNMLRTIEEAFSLGTLGREDEKAKTIEGIWVE